MIRQDRVRLSAIIYRKKGMSVEEFSKYWREEHAKLFANLPIVKKNLLKYEQVRLPSLPSPRLFLRFCPFCGGGLETGGEFLSLHLLKAS